MGEVFEALALGEGGFERRVALKRILPELSSDPKVRGAFLDEARIASRFHHGNIVQVTDYGTLDGAEFLVMEFVDGVHGGEASRRSRLRGQGIPVGIALHVLSEVAHALAYLHENAIVHRDVTPHNVLLSWNGDVKLSDFGIAGAIDPAGRAGRAEGKRRYMAPEQARGEPVTGGADVWAAAATLHALIVDAPPESAEIDAEVPDDVRALLELSLKKAPGERIGAAAFADRAGELASRRLHRNGRGALSEWLKAMRDLGDRDRGENVLDLFVIPAVSGGARRFTMTTISPSDAVRDAVPASGRGPISPVLFEGDDVAPRSTVPASDSPVPAPREPQAPSTSAATLGHAETVPSLRPVPSEAAIAPAPPAPITGADDARPSSPRATGPFPPARRRRGRWAAAIVLVASLGVAAAAAVRAAQPGVLARTKDPPAKVVLVERVSTPEQRPPEVPIAMVEEPVEVGSPRENDEIPSMRTETAAMRGETAMRAETEMHDEIGSDPATGTAWLRVGGAALMHGAVFVDGRAAGHAPVELPIATGTHRVVVRSADGAVLLEQSVTLGPEHTRSNALRVVR